MSPAVHYHIGCVDGEQLPAAAECETLVKTRQRQIQQSVVCV